MNPIGKSGSVNNPVNNQLTMAPAEYESMPKAINKIRKSNASSDTCPVPSAAKGTRSSTPKDKGGRSGMPCWHGHNKRAYFSFVLQRN